MAPADHVVRTKRRSVWILCCLAWSAGTGYAFYERYWRVRTCFNEQGRCWDDVNQEVLLEQAGIIWGTAAAIGLALAIPSIIGLLRSYRNPKSRG